MIAGAIGSRLYYVAASVTLFALLGGVGTGVVVGLALAGVLGGVLLAGYDYLLALVLPGARPAALEG